MKCHKQEWVKVNAPVDQDIAELVETLNSFPRLQTIESCQGGAKNGPWVCFVYGNHWDSPWKELAEFVLGYLGPGLAAQVGDRASVSIQIKQSGQIHGELAIRPGALKLTGAALRRLRRSYKV